MAVKIKIKLKDILKERGVSQKGFIYLVEKKTGEKIGKNTIHELVSGKRNCKLHTIALICKTLGLKPNDIIEIN